MRKATFKEFKLLKIAKKRWHWYKIPNGIPKKRKLFPKYFNQHQLAIGTKIELEHTSKPEIAMEIAMAHLAERPDYYELLEKMEKTPIRKKYYEKNRY